MKEVIELYKYAKEKHEVQMLFRILHHLSNIQLQLEKHFKNVFQKHNTDITVFITLRQQDEKYANILKDILSKISIEELKKALDVLYCIDYKYDEQRIKLDFAMIYNKDLKNMLIEKIKEKNRELAEKLTKIFSIVEIEVEKEEILKVTDPEHWFKKYGGIFVEGQIENDKGKIKIMKVASNKFVVDVWDCQARILLRDREQLFSFDEKYKNYENELFNAIDNESKRLAENIINLSGELEKDSIDLLNELQNAKVDCMDHYDIYEYDYRDKPRPVIA